MFVHVRTMCAFELKFVSVYSILISFFMVNLTFLAAPVVFMQTNSSQLAYTFWVHGKYICVLLKIYQLACVIE